MPEKAKPRHLVAACVLPFAIMVTLAGCSQDKAAAIDACQTEADRFFQGYRTDDVTNPRSRYVIECMAAKGLDFDITPAGCDSRKALPSQPACYVSNFWFDQLTDWIAGN